MTGSLRLLALLVATGLVASSPAQLPELTRIMQTGDAIPDSPGLTAGSVFRHAQMEGGRAVFLTAHEQFGASVPSNTILYWDGSILSKVADDDTPVPGEPTRKILLDDITDPDTISFDSQGAFATVLIWANYGGNGFAEQYALYRWQPGGTLQPYLIPDTTLSHIRPAIIRGGSVAVRSLPGVGDPADDGMTFIASNGLRTKLMSPGDEIPGEPGNTFDHVFDNFFFDGGRIVANLNATPPSRSGWWNLSGNGSVTPLLLIGENGGFNTLDIVAIDNSPSGAALAIGRGTQTEALLSQPNASAGFGVIAQRGNPTPGATGFFYHSFGGYATRAGFVVFAATSRSGNDEIHGIYSVLPQGVTSLIDSRSTVDGKNINFITLHHRDIVTNDIIFSIEFDDFTAGLYTMSSGGLGPIYADWISEQFPDANGDENIVGLLADPDNDRVPNLTEFTLGGEGKASDPAKTSPKPTAGQEFEYRRRAELPETITITPQVATTPGGPWQSGPTVLEEISSTPDPDDAEFLIVRVRSLLPASSSNVFFRLLVTSSE